jgi:diguanylate cyclase (GGDEF)-like protein
MPVWPPEAPGSGLSLGWKTQVFHHQADDTVVIKVTNPANQPVTSGVGATKGRPSWRERWQRFRDQVVASEAIDGPNASRFRAAQITAVSRLFPLVVLGNAVNSGAIAVMFAPLRSWIPIWYAIVVLALIAGRPLWRQVIHDGPVPRASRKSMNVLMLSVAGFAVIWGAVPLGLFGSADHNGQMLLATVVVGMMCAGGFILSAHVVAATVYLMILTVGSVIGLLTSSYASFPGLILMLLVYAWTLQIMVVASARVFMSRLRADAEAERQAQLVDLLLKDFEAHASDWLWEISPQGHLRHISMRLTESLGATPLELEQSTFLAFLQARQPKDHPEAHYALAHLAVMLQKGQSFRDIELALVVHGEVRWCSLTAKPLTDDRGSPSGWRGVGSDVTHARRSRDELARLANQDTLTGLANRHRFGMTLNTVLGHADAADRRCAVMFVDLDHFKTINDSLGHAVGDQLLLSAAHRLRECMPAHALLARLGGDEFAILLPGVSDLAVADQLASAVVATIGQPHALEQVQVTVRASVGVALAPKDAETPDVLLRCADMALYASKAAGRNTWRFFEPVMATHANTRVRLQQELGVALANEEFTLYYQPQIDFESGELSGFEALVRWQHGERGIISPGEFIPVAEETGQIVTLGTWVLKQACRQARAWPAHVRVAVNLSAVQFRQSDVVAVVDEALADSGLPPHRLELEITESALIDDHDEVRATLMALRERGIRVALDDFGTGYSSLAYLKNLPLDKLKIDGMFVRNLVSDTDAQAVVRAIISLAQALRLETTAECVETRAQWTLLKALGCGDAQGYWMSRPLPSHEVGAYLERQALTTELP